MKTEYPLLAYVCHTAPDQVRVKVIDDTMTGVLKSYGFEYDKNFDDWILKTTPEEQPCVYATLRDNQICFANGPGGWPPGAFFEEWRDEGRLSGKYLSVSWRGKDDYYIQER